MANRPAHAVFWLLVLLSGGCDASARAFSSDSLGLTGADADVWAFGTEVRARLTSLTAASAYRCELLVGERAQPAQLDARGELRAQIALAPGDNLVRARCRAGDAPPLTSTAIHLRVPLTAGPRAQARLAEGFLDGSVSRPSEHAPAALSRYVWQAQLEDGRSVPLGEGARLPLPPEAASVRSYQLQVSDALGRTDVAAVSARDPLAPWAAQAVVYGVLPPVFGQPPLAAVTRALPEIAALGVSALWLSPIFTPADGDYGYAVRDYFALRPDFGSEAELRALVEQAHALGLSVLLDLPANHTAREHPYFAQASALGSASHYFPFYVRDDLGEPTHYFDWSNLPNLNYDTPEVARFMQQAALHWLDAFHVDGFRIDAAWGIRVRTPGYFPQLLAELRRAHPEVVLIAEAPARDAYYDRALFAAAYDWTEQLGEHAWAHVFDAPQGIARRLAASVPDTPAAPEHAPRVLRFLNNNDTGPRFITRHGLALTRVATAALLTLPGIPCLFSLDEQGAAYEPYALRGIPAPAHAPELRALHARLIHLRRAHPALHGEVYHLLYAGARDEALVYLRESADEQLVVALNFGARPARVRLPPLPFARARDLLSDRSQELQAGLALAAWDIQLLTPQ